MKNDKEILKPFSERLSGLTEEFEELSEKEKKLFYNLFVLNLKDVFGKHRYHLFTDEFRPLISTISYFIKSAVSLTCFVYSFLYLKNNKKNKNHLLYLIPGINLISFFKSIKIGYFFNIRTNIAFKGNIIPGILRLSKIQGIMQKTGIFEGTSKLLDILFIGGYDSGPSLAKTNNYIFPSHFYRMNFEYILRDPILLYMISKKISSPLKNSNFLIIYSISNFIINILAMILDLEDSNIDRMYIHIMTSIIYLLAINLITKKNLKRFNLNAFLLFYYSAAFICIMLPLTDRNFGTTIFNPEGGGDFVNLWLNNQLLNYFDIIIIIYSTIFLLKK
jgi:hypothetical protein